MHLYRYPLYSDLYANMHILNPSVSFFFKTWIIGDTRLHSYIITGWKMSKCGVFSGPYFPTFVLKRRDMEYLFVFSPNAGKYGPEKTPYLDTFHLVHGKLYSTDVFKLLSRLNIKSV